MICCRIKIRLPAQLDKILVEPLLLLRLIWYGYSFRRIPLTNCKKYAIVDVEDYYELSQYTWWAYEKHGGLRAVRLAKEMCLNRPIFMHRQILNPPKDKSVDHINRNGLDNRKTNLRLATNRQNTMNRRFKKGTSKYKGVHFRRDINRWVGQICVNYEKIYLGVFESEIEAARAYDAAAKKYFDEFAYLNFPPEKKEKGLKYILESVLTKLKSNTKSVKA
jgi:hypothetical protein